MSELMGNDVQVGKAEASKGPPEKESAEIGGNSGKNKPKKDSNEPYLDLSSILRGKKIKVVHGADAVSECYALVVRILNRELRLFPL